MLSALVFVGRRHQGEFFRMRGHRFRLAEARMFRSVLGIAIRANHGTHLRIKTAVCIRPRTPGKQETQNLDGKHRKNWSGATNLIFNAYLHFCNHRLTTRRYPCRQGGAYARHNALSTSCTTPAGRFEGPVPRHSAESQAPARSSQADLDVEADRAGGAPAPGWNPDPVRPAMAATPQIAADPGSEHEQIVALTLKAIQLAKSAVAHAIDGLAQKSSAPFLAVNKCEQELDRLDREVDDRVTHAVIRASAPEAGELLACMKFMIDLERIGDLISSFGGCAQAIGARVEMEDVKDLIRMATVLEQMLVDIHDAFSTRNLDRVISVLRADAVIDRIRNLVFIRHVENQEG